jgi:hypothetical protein
MALRQHQAPPTLAAVAAAVDHPQTMVQEEAHLINQKAETVAPV